MSAEVLIVGGGPAGATAAWHLARAGRTPLLLEREAEPAHRICGEFLSYETHDALAAMGIDPLALGAQPIARLRLAHGERLAEEALPFRALGLSRLRLDAALLDAAAAAGARVRRGASVRRLDGMTALLDGGERIAAQALILATGKHDLRGAARMSGGTDADLVGFKMHYRLSRAQAQALAGHIEIMLFDGGYAGLQPVEDGRANLCLLVTRARFAEVGRTWSTLVAALLKESPHLDRRLAAADALFDRPLTIAGVPYGFLYRPAVDDPAGLYRVGDQFAVIPSFSGDGMAIAMHTGQAGAAALARGKAAHAYHAERGAELRRQLRLAGLMQRYGREGAAQAALVAAARLWPGLTRLLAAWTRIPGSARIYSALDRSASVEPNHSFGVVAS